MEWWGEEEKMEEALTNVKFNGSNSYNLVEETIAFNKQKFQCMFSGRIMIFSS